MPYNCPRCGYTCNQRGDIKKHFKRKTLCSPCCLDISIGECYEEVLGAKLKVTPIDPQVTPNDPQIGPKMDPNGPQMTPFDPKMTHLTPNDPQMTPNDPYQHLDFINSNFKKNSCIYCKKVLSKNSHMHRHAKRCKEKDAYTKEEVEEKVAEANAQNAAVIAELRNQNANLLQKVGNTTNNNTINIHLKAFGQENLSYITPEFIKDLIRYNLFSAIPKLLKEIHFNPEHTENRNTLVPSRKDTLAKTYNGDKWDFTSKDDVFEDMTDKAFNKLTEYGSGPKFEKFYDAYDDQDTGYLKKMKKQTEIMILNNQ